MTLFKLRRKSEHTGHPKGPADSRLPADDVARFSQIRDRLDANLRRWLNRGRSDRDLLRSPASLGEAKILIKNSRASLDAALVEYLEKSLNAQRHRQLLWRGVVLAVVAGSSVLIAALALRAWHTDLQSAGTPRSASQVQRRLADDRAQLTMRDLGPVDDQGTTLQRRLEDAAVKAATAQTDAQVAVSQRDAFQRQL
ncbi:MAG: hypothetical protein JO069_06520, partial [Verrucomicrobia bacterium]|nr:hypothetical protein [Verrucomicrobiota bacterium]